MSQPSNGITPEVIRGVMPPYELSPDLLQATFAAIPRPPPDATPTWRHAHLARLTQEISTLMPANAAQARIAAQILIYRELADAVATQAHASVTDLPLLCRLARTAATLGQTAAMLERSLIRYHQKPAPYFGTVLSDAVDIPALDAIWCGNPDQPPTAPEAALRRPPDPPNPSPPAQPTPPPAALTPTEPQPQPNQPPQLATAPAPDAATRVATTSEWTRTLLDSGPGWSREVLRHRSSPASGNGSIPGAAAR
jgi:hypothetical protein